MSEYRPIKQKIWHDSWFSTLNPEEKCFWLFLLTNEYTHISGIYELPKSLLSPLSGCPNANQILDKFIENKKIDYIEGYVFIKNYLKNQTQQINKKDNIYKSIIAYLKENPKLVDWFYLNDEAPYKSLLSPLVAPSESSKVVKYQSSKVIKRKGNFKNKLQRLNELKQQLINKKVIS